jgi:hypothetical protein
MTSWLESKDREGLIALLDMLIPADPAHGLPSGSEVGFSPDASYVDGLKILNEASAKMFDKNFHILTLEERQTLIGSLSRVQKMSFTRLAKTLAEHYYLRPEVAEAIGARAEPPFPEGYCVEEGDIALVESVYLRGKIFRDV